MKRYYFFNFKNCISGLSIFFATSFFLCSISANAQVVNTIADTGRVGIGTVNPQCNLEVKGESRFIGNLRVDSSLIVNDSVRTNDLRVSGSLAVSGDIITNGSIGLGGSERIGVLSSGPLSGIYLGRVPPTNSPIFNTCNYPVLNTSAINMHSQLNVWSYNNTAQTDINLITLQADASGGYIDFRGNHALGINYYCGKDVALCTGPNGGVVSVGHNLEIGGIYPRDLNVAANINGRDKTALQILGNYTSPGGVMQKFFVNSGSPTVIAVLDGANSYNQSFTLLPSGRIGINNTNPAYFLDVASSENGLVSLDQRESAVKKNNLVLKNHSELATGLLMVLDKGGNISYPFYVEGSGYTQLNINPNYNGGDALAINDAASGKTNFKVKTNGLVYAREIKVQLTNFPDYVFEKDYALPSLNEIEEFIHANKHLPGMPSAKEVEAEGAALGEILKKNVENTEQLYLYIIEMKKEIEQLKAENKNLKANKQQ